MISLNFVLDFSIDDAVSWRRPQGAENAAASGDDMNIRKREHAGRILLRQLGIDTADAARLILEAAEALRLRADAGRSTLILRLRELLRAGAEALRRREQTRPFAEVARLSLAARAHRRPLTLRDLHSFTNRLLRLPGVAESPLRSIGADECRRMLESAFGRSAHSYRKGRAILHSIFAYGRRQGWCSANPVDAIDAPPVREAEEFPCVCVRETEEGRLYDFGSNFSGYVRLKTSAPAGTELILEHAEEIDGALRLKRNGLGIYYPSVPCQTDKVICAGGELVWSPKFTYHGFRYVLLRCVQGKPPAAQLCGVFVHQAAEQTGRFSCDVPLLDRIFAAGIRSSLSNMFYSLTDCPTREKLGWTNDAAASAEQLLLHFDCASLFRKIAQDLADAQREDGCMPGIVPTDGWGYDIGPVTDAFLYELPYRLYLYAADTETARFLYPYCLRNLRYLGGRLERGEWFDLGDWTGACNKGDNAPFVQCMLLLFFLKKMLVLADALGEEKAELLRMQARFEQKVREEYLCGGDYTGGGQTAPAMLLVYGMGEREKLRARLLDAVRAADTHLDCGMIGTQYIYDALSLLGEQDLVLRMVCAEGAPSFAHWFSEGATALWETFEGGKTESKNHHMFSNILAWFTKCIAGIRVLRPYEAEIAPLPFAAVKRAEGEVRLLGKTLRVRVERRGKTLRVAAEVPEGIAVYANGKKLPAGTNVFCVPPADGDKDGKKTEQEE